MRKVNINFAGKNRRVPALLIVTALVLFAIAGVTFARYVLQEDHSGVAEAKPFYFTSDLLKEESESREYHIDPAGGSFEITLSNAADSMRITQDSISVKVEAKGGTVASEGNVTLQGGTESETKITITPDSSASSVKVTATSESPYQKTLCATFLLSASQYKVEDAEGKRAAVLTVTCGKIPDNGIQLIVPSGIVPDATNELITKEDSGFQLHPEEPGVYTLVLLKKNVEMNISKEETDFTDNINITQQ